MIKILLAAVAAAGMLVAAAPATPAQADQGCVTIGEARNVLESGLQDRREIERGFADDGVKLDRRSGTLWVTYTPCVRPDSARSFVDVVYVRNSNGNWKTFYWVWSLFRPASFRVAAGEWGPIAGGRP